MKLSVIIPFYNAELHIERCVLSLMEQTMKDDVEFIFIDDASTDNSMTVLLRTLDMVCPQRQQQVRIIENEQRLGVTETRRRGLAVSNGDYIAWSDADDWSAPEKLERMWQASEDGKTDIIICNYWEETINTRKLVSFRHFASPQDCIAELWKGDGFPVSFWQQMVKRDIISEALSHVIDTNYGEDIYASFYTFFISHSITYIDEPLYHYNSINESSLVHNIDYNFEAWLSQRKNIETICKLLDDAPDGQRYRVAMSYFKFHKKQLFRDCFPNLRYFYKEFSECYKDVNTFLYTPKNQRIKTFLLYNCYPLFWLHFRNTWR